MTLKRQIEDIADWLRACVNETEAGGYQNHEDEAWAAKPPEIKVSDSGLIMIFYDGRTFSAKLGREKDGH